MPSAADKVKSRSTRLPSPIVRNNGTATPAGPSDAWVEPTLKPSKPTYEDHGGMPYGVLEDMQPLGQRPNAKVKARVKPDSLRKSLGKSFGYTQDHAAQLEVPSAASTPVSRSPAPMEQIQVSTPETATQVDTVENDGMAAEGQRSTRPRRTRTSTAAVPEQQEENLVVQTTESADTKPAPRSSPGTSPLPSDVDSEEINHTNFEAIVEVAVERARSLGHDSFGAAIQQVFVESKDHPRYSHLLRAVLLQTATADEQEEFTTAIKRAKRTIRRSMSSFLPARRSLPSLSTESPDIEMRNAATRRSRGGAESHNGKPGQRKARDDLARNLTENPSELPGALRATPALNVSATPRVKVESEQPANGSKSNDGPLNDYAASPSLSPVPDEVVAATVQGLDKDVIHHELSKTALARPMMEGITGGASTTSEQQNGATGIDDGHISDGSELSNLPPDWEDNATMINEEPSSKTAGLTHALDIEQSRKRSPGQARIDEMERDAIEYTKRRKLTEATYKDLPPNQKHTQSSVRPVMVEPTTRPRRQLANQKDSRAEALNMTEADLEHGNGEAESRPRRGREATDSPLSDVASITSTPPMPVPSGEFRSTRGLKKAKTKQSPEKKQHHLNGEGFDDQNGRSGDDDESVNNDYCNACGGTGYLLCCDGCDRSFHFNCVDPPLDASSSALDEPWYCYTCVAKRHPPARPARGLFSSLLLALEKRNPSIFALPAVIRNYHANVHTGKDGKFEDPANIKTRTRAGYDEPLDLLKSKDNKGNNILCYYCGCSAAGKREIITCDVCGNHWHLDCTDPPLANPPFRDQLNRKSRDWMCPLHIEHDLSAIDPMRLSQRRRIHIRRPRNARVVDSSLRRGHVNNGIIDVLEDESSDEELSDLSEDESSSGVVVRVPSKGIKLDFIDKVHRLRAAETNQDTLLPAPVRSRMTSRVLQARLNSHPLAERQAVLTLVQSATQTLDLGYTEDKLLHLVNVLTVEAPPAVAESVARDESIAADEASRETRPTTAPGGGAGALQQQQQQQALTELERLQLERIEALIRQRLGRA